MKKIGVALSGGLDSAVTALTLQRAGYEVQAWHIALPKFQNGCSSYETRGEADAQRVADFLKIEFRTIDLTDVFLENVIKPFVDAYSTGYTPNPCLFCNPKVKFGALMNAMQNEGGCDEMATGHYALIENEPNTGIKTLRKAPDATKDQTYFLYALTHKQLDCVQFPIGSWTRQQVREIAEEAGLPVHDKKSSQDICFLPDGDYRPLVTRFHPEAMQKGKIIDDKGKILGTHLGVANYTIGQRRGLGVATGGRVFVTKIDLSENTVTLGPRTDLEKFAFEIDSQNWLVKENFPLECDAVSRYHSKSFRCKVEQLEHGKAKVTTAEPQFLITPGQACVFYRNDFLLGGGRIL